MAESEAAITQARSLLAKTRTHDRTNSKIIAIIELIETIAVYKFPQLSREEIERMFGLSELRETKVYQEASAEGALNEAQSLILRQLSRRIGTLTPARQAQVQSLSLTQLESLGEALLDFSAPTDLENWLASQASSA